MLSNMKYTNNDNKEIITHEISNRPYSMHLTYVSYDIDLALYQHWHEEIEILYLEKGEIEFVVEEKRYTLKKGEAILIPPNLLHMATKEIGSECLFYAFVFNSVLFTESYINSEYARFIQPLKHNGLLYTFKFSSEIKWQNDFLALLKKIFRFRRQPNIDLWELDLHGLLYQLWNLYYINHMTTINFSNNYTNLYNKLKNSIAYIHKYYASDLTIQLLAEQSGLCVGTFCRYFKMLTGLTPFTYLNRHRIKISCEALSDTGMKITQIAVLCGFNNISHFNRSFLQYVKCTPTEYRKQNV